MAEATVVADKQELDLLLFDLIVALASIRDDEHAVAAGLWQGKMIPRNMRNINRMRRKLGMQVFNWPEITQGTVTDGDAE